MNLVFWFVTWKGIRLGGKLSIKIGVTCTTNQQVWGRFLLTIEQHNYSSSSSPSLSSSSSSSLNSWWSFINILSEFSLFTLKNLTFKKVFISQVTNTQSQYREFIQSCNYIFRERKKLGKVVEFTVQSIPVTLWWIDRLLEPRRKKRNSKAKEMTLLYPVAHSN